MNIATLRKIKPFYFGHRELAEVFRIREASAAVTCNRYVRKGLLIRAKRDVYLLRDRWESADRTLKFSLANRLQVPSYVSLTTALSYYEVTTQVQQDFFESISVTKTMAAEVDRASFRYFKIQPALYFGYIKRDGFFIAIPEKAFLDALYLQSLGRYRLDMNSLDCDKLDKKLLKKLSGPFPLKVKEYFKKYASIG